MAKAEVNREYLSFVKGLITEASPFNFPENASIDEDNFVLNRDGTRSRRLGFDYEDSYGLTDTGVAYTATSSKAISIHKWDGVGNVAKSNFIVVQFGDILYFFNTQDPVSDQYISNVTLTKRSGGQSGNNRVDVASGLGVLVVTGHDFVPQYIEYDEDTQTFSTNTITIKIRDFFGVDDGLDVGNNPASLTESHEYNLLNQGWSGENILAFFDDNANYPSNAQIDFVGKYTDISTGLKTWDSSQITGTSFGTTPAPKGKFILNAFSRSASRGSESGISSLATDFEYGRPITTAFFNGRILYGGVRSNPTGTETTKPDYDGYIFFSPILDTLDKIGYCYQEADPTSEYISQLVATDGGTIHIPDMSNLFLMVALKSSVICVAENGVWEVKAGTSGFAADDYSVRKITERGALNAGSVVNVEDAVAYWNESGIYIITGDEVSGDFVSKNLTETTIHTFYSDISAAAKQNTIGVYDALGRKVRWMYNGNDSYTGTSYKNSYNKELIFDITLTAFYPHTIAAPETTVEPFVAGYIVLPFIGTKWTAEDVTDDSVVVTDDAVDVTYSTVETVPRSSAIRFLTFATTSNAASGNWFMTVGAYKSTTFLDWVTPEGTGVDYSSYLHTGYEVLQDSARYKSSIYLTAHFNRTETGFTDDGSGNLTPIRASSCFITPRWDFADNQVSNKYGTKFQAYRLRRNYVPTGVSDTFTYGQNVITTKNKIRGSGRALTLYIESEAGKDMQILGWNVGFTGRTRV